MNETSKTSGRFTSFEPLSNPPARPKAVFSPAAPPVLIRPRQSRPRAGLFALLIASVCAFSLLFALEIASSPLPYETLAVFRSAMTPGVGEHESGDEQLGRLKLVSLPGMLEVFAPSSSPILPVSADSGEVRDDLTAKIFAGKGNEVFSVLPGTVRSVSDDGSGAGGVVTVAHDGDIEVSYYGLTDIEVERGQPVLQRTVLGRLSRDVLIIRVTRAGRPIDPLEFLGVSANLG